MSGRNSGTRNETAEGKPGWFSKNAWIVLIAILVYVIVLGLLSIRRYDSYQADTFDLGIMEQTIWNTSHGRILTESVNNGYPASRLWSGRWELIYLPISLIHRVFPHPYTALLFQTVMLALGALPLYLLARYKLGDGALAAIIPVAYLLYPALHNANLFDIHGIAMATPMVFMAFYFIEKKATRPTHLFILLLLFCREDTTFIAFMLGLYAWVIAGERKMGLTVMAASVAWFLFSQNIVRVRPLLDLPVMSDPNVFPDRWEAVGGSSPISFAWTVIRDPLGFIRLFWKVENLKFIVKLLSPVGFLSLLSPAALVMMLPNLIVNMVTNSPTTRDIYHQYTGTITPVVFISLTVGLRNLFNYFDTRSSRPGFLTPGRYLRPSILSVVLITTSVTAAALWSRVPYVASFQVTAHHRTIDRFITRLPPGASVSVHSLIGPHVAHRELLYLFPDGVGDAEYILYDLVLPYNRPMSHLTWSNPIVVPITDQPFLELLNDTRYGIIAFDDGAVLFRRNADYAEGLKRFARQSPGPGNVEAQNVDIGNIRLIGIEVLGVSGNYDRYKHLVFYWMWTGNERNAEYPLTLVIEGRDYRKRVTHDPMFGKLNDVLWEKGMVIRDDVYLPITGITPGSYMVYMINNDKGLDRPDTHDLVTITVGPDDLVSK